MTLEATLETVTPHEFPEEYNFDYVEEIIETDTVHDSRGVWIRQSSTFCWLVEC